MKPKKFTAVVRGIAATTATLLALSTVGYSIALSPLALGYVDGAFGISSREIFEEKTEYIQPVPGAEDYKISNYEKTHATAEEYFAALKAHTIEQGEQGFALMKNDNNALPLAAGANVALFGYAGWHHEGGKRGFPHTGVLANNSDIITLAAGLSAAGLNVNNTMTADDFTGKTAGASLEYTIAETFEVKDAWQINKATTTGIVVLSRGGGEGANYMTDSATNAEDPLALSDAEKNMISYAKEHCSKVVVLIESANAMELGDISKGGDLEVDAIGFCAIPNAYQYQGIANVLAGKVNATGGMTDTYVYDNSYTPAVINMGQQQYTDADIVNDTTTRPDALGREGINYRHANYIVQAEGVYVGYKYYETRYYDSIVNSSSNAKDSIGSTTGNAWDYKNEVLYTFGHGLSYVPYSQKITDVDVTLFETGNVVATVEVTNEGTQDSYFTTQLYVNRPYTEYDKENNVEKSAIDFLNSARVFVKAGKTETVKIEVPTKYLASWDSNALNGEGTYILDAGDYYFTAACGAHEAVNNVLKAQGHTTDGTTELSDAIVWSEITELDDKTFSVSNGYDVRNQAENVDINYYLDEKDHITYLSRSDWKGTFPKNWTNLANDSGIQPEEPFTIAGSPKEEEWINELRNIQYVPTEAENEADYAKVEATLPENVGEGKQFATVWEYIMNMATTDPISFNDIKSEKWQAVAQAINLNVAVGNIINGGGATDSWYGIDNPTSTQSESVAGYSQNLTVNGENRNLAVASNTLLASSFNPELAYEWGVLEGQGGLWLMAQGVASGNAITVWGGGLNQHRHAYNGRNSEYMSEDPMLTNRMGYNQFKGLMENGSICGPKHMGFNDQELNRQGNACYMTEQKMRETDIRCYEGALGDAKASGVMMSFARIGATNVTNHVGLNKHIMREEWGFTGIITTDMGMAGYHDISALIMATCNQLAGFGSNDARIGSGPDDFSDEACKSGAAHSYLTLGVLRKDPVLAEQARQTSLYELYTIAHSASGIYVRVDDSFDGPQTITTKVKVGEIEIADWEYIFIYAGYATAAITALAGVIYIGATLLAKKEEN